MIYSRDLSNMHNLHKKKLECMKSTVAALGYSARPKTIPQVVRANLKKRMYEDERLAEIEVLLSHVFDVALIWLSMSYSLVQAENARLLSSMSKIMDSPDQMSRLNRASVSSRDLENEASH